jgi:hypothetical protein
MRMTRVSCAALALSVSYLHVLCLQMFGGLVQGALGTMTGEAVATEVMSFFFHASWLSKLIQKSHRGLHPRLLFLNNPTYWRRC